LLHRGGGSLRLHLRLQGVRTLKLHPAQGPRSLMVVASRKAPVKNRELGLRNRASRRACVCHCNKGVITPYRARRSGKPLCAVSKNCTKPFLRID
jgi:hypothetical protein